MSGSAAARPRARWAAGLFAIQLALILLVATVAAGIAVVTQVEQTRREAESDVSVLANSLASLSILVEGLQSDDPAAAIQPVATALSEAAGVEYVTVADMDGIRVAHPVPELVGVPVSSDHAPIRAGGTFSGIEEGPLGLTLRAKVPVRAEGGEIVGTVSVGVLVSTVDSQTVSRVVAVAAPTVIAVLIGTVVAWFATARLRRRLYGVGPDDMLALVQARQATADGVRDGIVGIDQNGRVSLANSEARRLLGVSSDVVGEPAARVLPPDLVAVATQASEADDRWVRQLSTGGRTLIVSGSRAVADGRDVGTMLVVQDRSELDAMLAALEQERRRAAELRVETHDFDNRMHVVAGLLELGELDDARTYLDALPRAERPGASGDWERIESPLLAALLASRQRHADARAVDVSLTDDSEVSPDFVCGAEEITVVGNLLSNAIEAAEGRVEVFLRGDRFELEAIVDDDGPGVPTAIAASIFEPGRTSKIDDAWRHGVGLDVVRGYVRERGGLITVEDSPLGGARFTVHLPSSMESSA